MASCLPKEQLAAFERGGLGASERSQIEEHLRECDSCRRRIVALPDVAASTLIAGGERAADRGSAPPAPPDSSNESVAFAETIAGEPAVSQATDVPAIARGDSIGRLFVLDEIGAGGMGKVYAAYDPELDRRVALKVLRSDVELAGPAEFQSRLLREAQAMARLSHPNVITVYDVGTYRGGLYIAMEFVQGGTLTQWLRERSRSAAQIIDVFVRAGRGLGAAHSAGLVHRDFKPDNVLVGADGSVRVTDFGVARPLGTEQPRVSVTSIREQIGAGQAAISELLTRDGTVIGTPAYMSYEQLIGKPADQRSDEFSFCVALYEALYGVRPFAGDTIPALLQAMLEPRLTEPVGSARVPVHVRRALARGLRASAEERYPSMDALLNDLIRDPAAKTRRAMLGVTAALLVIALGVGGWVARNRSRSAACAGADAQLRGVWDAPRRDAGRRAFLATGRPYAARSWQSIESRLDSYANLLVTMRTEACEATRIRGEQSEHVLGLRNQCLDARLRDLAALSRQLADADAKTVDRASEAMRTLPPISACADARVLARYEQRSGSAQQAEKVGEVRDGLAAACAMRTAGRFSAGLTLATDMVRRARELQMPALEAEALYEMGRLQFELGQLSDAESTLNESGLSAVVAGDERAAAQTWNRLGSLVGNRLARPAEGLLWLRYSNAAIARLGGDDELEAENLMQLAQILAPQGNFDEAVEAARRAVPLFEKAGGKDSIDVGRALSTLATTLSRLGAYDEALASHQRTLQIMQGHLGAEHPDTSRAAMNLAYDYLLMGRAADAIPLLEEQLAIRQRIMPPRHPNIANAMINLARALEEVGQPKRALELSQDALALLEPVIGKDNPDLSEPLTTIGLAQLGMANAERAVAPLQRALSLAPDKSSIPGQKAWTEFALAKVLVSLPHASSEQREHARELLRSARAVFAENAQRYGGPYNEARLSTVDAWTKANQDKLGP